MSANKLSHKAKEPTKPQKRGVFQWVKRHPVVFWLTLITILATFLRFFALGSESIWLDEAYSIIESHLSIQGIAASSNQPPVYFWILRVWIDLFGTSEVALRSLSAIFGVFSVVAIYFAGTALLNKKAGLFSAFIASFAVFAIVHSQDARAYSLLMLLSTLSYWFFIEIFQKDEKKCYIAYTVVSVLLIYTHFFGLFIIASQVLFYLIFIKKFFSQRLKYIIPLAIFIVSIIPLFLLLNNNISRIGSGNFWISEPSNMAVVNTLVSFSGSGSARYVIFTIFILIAIWGIFTLFRKNTKPHKKNPGTHKPKIPSVTEEKGSKLGHVEIMVLLLLWLFIPILIPFIESKIMAPIYQSKYVIGAYPALALMVGNGIVSLKSKWIITPVLILIIILSSFVLYNYYKYDSREQWRETVQFINTESQPGDLILICNSYYQKPFDYYYQGDLKEQGISSTEDATDFINSEDGQSLTQSGRLWLILAYNKLDIYNVLANAYGKDSVKYIQYYYAITIVLFNPSGN